jgi:DNA replication and repair protein RecF
VTPLLLLDEVAAHLDPGRRASLYDEVVALGAHALMTATEKGLFAEMGDRAQYWDAAEAGGATTLTEGGPP